MNNKLSLTPSLQEKSLLRTNLDNCKFENNLCVLAENIPIAYSSKKFKLRLLRTESFHFCSQILI